MKIPFLDLRTQYIELKNEIDAAVLRVLDSGWYILGKECESFEQAFKDYLVGDSEGYVIAVNSGTDALKLSLLESGVGPGDEVITVANTAIPTVTAICSVGAVPVFCDVDPCTWLIDPKLIAQHITGHTKALLPVHLYGGVCDMAALRGIAENHGLKLIEDVAQATGSLYNNWQCGTMGDFGAFSFYPSKNLGANGDGGAIYVKSEEVCERLKMLRNYGQSSRYYVDLIGGENSRLDEMQAAILSVKLKHLNRWNMMRKKMGVYYRQRIKTLNLPIQIQQDHPESSVVTHLFVIMVEPSHRDVIQQRLFEYGIQTLIHYPMPLYKQQAFSAFLKKPNLQSEILCSSALSLPFHPYLSEKEIDFIVEKLADVMTFVDRV